MEIKYLILYESIPRLRKQNESVKAGSSWKQVGSIFLIPLPKLKMIGINDCQIEERNAVLLLVSVKFFDPDSITTVLMVQPLSSFNAAPRFT